MYLLKTALLLKTVAPHIPSCQCFLKFLYQWNVYMQPLAFYLSKSQYIVFPAVLLWGLHKVVKVCREEVDGWSDLNQSPVQKKQHQLAASLFSVTIETMRQNQAPPRTQYVIHSPFLFSLDNFINCCFSNVETAQFYTIFLAVKYFLKWSHDQSPNPESFPITAQKQE